MATRKKTPAGITLDELLKSYKDQNLDIPSSVKELISPKIPAPAPTVPTKAKKEETKPPKPKEIEKLKVKGASRESKHNLSEDELYDKAVALVQSEGKMDERILAYRLSISRPLAKKLLERMAEDGFIEQRQTKAESVVQNLVGKNVASKLVKKQPEEEPVKTQEPVVVPKTPQKPAVDPITNNGDLKVIRATTDEIHQFLLGQKKPLGPAMPRTNRGSTFFKSFLGGLTNHGVAEKFFPNKHLHSPTHEKVTPDTPSPLLQKVPIENAHAEIGKLQTNLFQDQQTAQHTKEFVQQEDDAKSNREKLDKIQASLDEMKKKLDTLLGRNSSRGSGIGGLLGSLAGVWNLLKMAWGAIKFIGKNVAKIFREIGKVTAWIASKGWDLLKGGIEKLSKRVLPIIEKIAERVGLAEVGAGALALGATAATAYATDRIAKYEYDRGMAPFKQLEQDYGLKALGNGNFEVNGKKYHNYGDSEVHGDDDLPEQYKTLINAKTGDTRGGTSKRAQDYIKDHQAEFDALKSKPIQPQKALPTALSKVTQDNADLESDSDSNMPVIVVKGGNKTTVLPAQPAPIGVVVSPRNPDASADALNGDLFDLPQGYGSLGRM